jgi:hypothetical protein
LPAAPGCAEPLLRWALCVKRVNSSDLLVNG